MKISHRRQWFFSVIILLAGAGILVLFFHATPKADKTQNILILSPHYDDAVLSLGGLMAQAKSSVVVATFFSGEPDVATSTSWDQKSGFTNSHDAMIARSAENEKALGLYKATIKNYGYLDNQYRIASSSTLELEQEIASDIQALIASYGDKPLSVYGPAIFIDPITHADHAIVHQVYLDVAKNFPNPNVTFYIYEDYPYVDLFNKASVITLQRHLENELGSSLDPVTISLTRTQVNLKEKALSQYSSQAKAFDKNHVDIADGSITYTTKRCGENKACEVVYKLPTL